MSIDKPDRSASGVATGYLDGTDKFVERYGRAVVVVFAALWVTMIPVVNLVRVVPLFKEIVLGAVVVAVFTSLEDWGQGAKHALVAGMTAAILFNLLLIPGSILLGLLGGAANAGSPEVAAATGLGAGVMGAFGVFVNLIGLVLFSPLGYIAGGAVGSLAN
jgi:hypothetical protein